MARPSCATRISVPICQVRKGGLPPLLRYKDLSANLSGQEGWLAPAVALQGSQSPFVRSGRVARPRCCATRISVSICQVRKGGLPPLLRYKDLSLHLSGQEGWLAPAVALQGSQSPFVRSGRLACLRCCATRISVSICQVRKGGLPPLFALQGSQSPFVRSGRLACSRCRQECS